jgi:hypothetical protein
MPIGKYEVHARFCWENLMGRDCLEVLGIDGRIILKWNLKKSFGSAFAVLMWLRIETDFGLL